MRRSRRKVGRGSRIASSGPARQPSVGLVASPQLIRKTFWHFRHTTLPLAAAGTTYFSWQCGQDSAFFPAAGAGAAGGGGSLRGGGSASPRARRTASGTTTVTGRGGTAGPGGSGGGL